MKIPVVWVTGGARRVGAEIVRTLHAAGMNIVLHYYRSQEAAEQLAARLNAKRAGSVKLLQQDLAAPIEQLAEQVAVAVSLFGRLDVLVNNASSFYPTPLGTVDEIAWNGLLDSNLKAPFFLSQAAAPHLRLTQGSIVNICDIHGERPLLDYSVYCVAKAGLLMLTKVLAKELAPAIRVNAISPGPVAWPEGVNTLSDAMKQKILAQTPLGRHGDPIDIAKTVRFLVQEAEYVTGQVWAVDGGRSLGI